MSNKKQKITIITSLNNIDFDIISSLFAAHKLYQNSYVVFEPLTKNFKNDFINSTIDLFQTLSTKKFYEKIDNDEVDKIVLVGSIKQNSELFKKIKQKEIIIYSDNSKKKERTNVFYEEKSQSKSVASFLALKIEERKIHLLPEEATIILLGIYYKSKMLTLNSTTKEDFLSAGFLKEKGAEIDLVSKIISGEKNVSVKEKAKDIMTFPPLALDHKKSCKAASIFMTQYNVNSILITDKNKLLGYISRGDVEKALFHKLGRLAVSNYMKTNFQVVDIEDTLTKIQKEMSLNNQRILPVISNNKIAGVITRTDILSALVKKEEAPDIEKDIHKFTNPLSQKSFDRKNIANFLKKNTDEYIYKLLLDLGEIATKEKTNIYIVGGFVRDLLLSKKNYDIDIVVEGDGIEFAKKYAATQKASMQSFKKFGTAYVKLKDGFKVDFASARTETYSAPASLPKVQNSSVNLDLFRRDFTVNTLIIQLNSKKFGELIDYFSAQKDLKNKKIRVLHNFSFIEDPTRIFRALRFEQRFAFEIGETTSRLIDNAVKTNVFATLKGLRIFTELKLIFEEETPFLTIKRLFDYGVLNTIFPLKPSTNLLDYFQNVKKAVDWQDKLKQSLKEKKIAEKWILYLFALIKDLKEKDTLKVCKRLELTPKHTKLFSKDRFEADKVLKEIEKTKNISNSEIYKKLSNFSFEIILYLTIFVKDKKIRDLIKYYHTDLKFITPILKDEDLKSLGIKEKAKRTLILKKIKFERLDDHNIKTKKDEIALVKKIAK